MTSQSVADDGTAASADATLLQVTLLGADPGTLLTIDVVPMSAAAPVGGVDCEAPEVAEAVLEQEEEPEVLDVAQDTSMPRTGGGLALAGVVALAGAGLLVRRR